MSDTYTKSPYEQRVAQARSTFGDNPAAVKAGVASQMIKESQPLNEAIGGQEQAVQQLAEYDKKLSQEYQASNQANQAQQQAQGQAYTQARQMGATDPSSAQNTIAMGAASFDPSTYGQVAGGGGILSPFVVSGLGSGQVGAITDVYNLADQQRGSLERAIGTEAEAIANMLGYQIAAEKERKEQERADQEFRMKQEEFDLIKRQAEAEMAELGGSTGILDEISSSGKTFIEEVTDDLGSFIDVIRQNPGLTDAEILELAKANVNKYGPFKESNQELADMGLGIIATDPRLTSENAAKGGSTGLIDKSDSEILQMAYEQGIELSGETQTERVAEARAKLSGGVESKPTETSEEAQKALQIAQELLGQDYKGITGLFQFRGMIPSTKAQLAKNTYKQLRSFLSLDNLKYLKGTGQISDREQQILMDASTNLGRNLSDKQFKATLEKLIRELGGEAGVETQQQWTDEADEALINKYKQLNQ